MPGSRSGRRPSAVAGSLRSRRNARTGARISPPSCGNGLSGSIRAAAATTPAPRPSRAVRGSPAARAPSGRPPPPPPTARCCVSAPPRARPPRPRTPTAPSVPHRRSSATGTPTVSGAAFRCVRSPMEIARTGVSGRPCPTRRRASGPIVPRTPRPPAIPDSAPSARRAPLRYRVRPGSRRHGRPRVTAGARRGRRLPVRRSPGASAPSPGRSQSLRAPWAIARPYDGSWTGFASPRRAALRTSPLAADPRQHRGSSSGPRARRRHRRLPRARRPRAAAAAQALAAVAGPSGSSRRITTLLIIRLLGTMTSPPSVARSSV